MEALPAQVVVAVVTLLSVSSAKFCKEELIEFAVGATFFRPILSSIELQPFVIEFHARSCESSLLLLEFQFPLQLAQNRYPPN